MAVLKIFDLNGKTPASAGLPSKVTSSIFIGSENRPITIGLGFGVKTVTFGGYKQRKAHIVIIPGTSLALSRQRSWDVIVNTSVVKTMEKAAAMLTPTSTGSPYLQYETADGKQVSPIIFRMSNYESSPIGSMPNYNLDVTVDAARVFGTQVFSAKSHLPRKDSAPAFVRPHRSFALNQQAEFLQNISDFDTVNTHGFPLENKLWDWHDKGRTTLGSMTRNDIERIGKDQLGWLADTFRCEFTYNEFPVRVVTPGSSQKLPPVADGSLVYFTKSLLALKPGEKKVLEGPFGRTKKILIERLSEPAEKGREYSMIFIQDEMLASQMEKALPFLQEGKPYIFQEGDRLVKIDANTKPAKYTAAKVVNVEISKFTVKNEGNALTITGFDNLMKS